MSRYVAQRFVVAVQCTACCMWWFGYYVCPSVMCTFCWNIWTHWAGFYVEYTLGLSLIVLWVLGSLRNWEFFLEHYLKLWTFSSCGFFVTSQLLLSQCSHHKLLMTLITWLHLPLLQQNKHWLQQFHRLTIDIQMEFKWFIALYSLSSVSELRLPVAELWQYCMLLYTVLTALTAVDTCKCFLLHVITVMDVKFVLALVTSN